MNASTAVAGREHEIERALSALHIDGLCVEIVDDRVYLKGVAACYERKRQAAALAAAAAPDACIENEIRVAGSNDAGDEKVIADVTAAIASRLGPEVLGRITIDASGDSLAIRGAARSPAEAHAIAHLAWETVRSRRIECHLSTEGAAPSDADVQDALNRYVAHAMGMAHGAIRVRYDGGVASLSGTVPSAVQREAIEDLVRWHDRVSDVINRLQVGPPQAATRGAPTAL